MMGITSSPIAGRLYSLDVFRGAVMFLLIGEAAGFHHSFGVLAEGNQFFTFLADQLHHHPWNGLRFWDLIQPFFMFIVGVAMPFSIGKRLRSSSRQEVNKHIFRRCFLLLLFGVLLHCVYAKALVWELWNVLTQLSVTILIAYAIMNRSHRFQILISFLLLLLTEISYRMYDPSAPYNDTFNFGSAMDMIFMGKTNGGGWVTINFIPTAAHTIWGVVCGKVLLDKEMPASKKVSQFITASVLLFLVGYGLDLAGITPIIKRIASTSFTLASGGWCLLTLAVLYYLIDVKNRKPSWLFIFSVVGTNSIFIYLFAQSVGSRWFRDFWNIFTEGILSIAGFSNNWIALCNSFVVWGFFWYLTYWLHKRRIYFKI